MNLFLYLLSLPNSFSIILYSILSKSISYSPFTMVKSFSEQQVDDLIKLKFGRLVESADHVQYVSNAILGKIFGVSAAKIRQVYQQRFQSIAEERLSFLQ